MRSVVTAEARAHRVAGAWAPAAFSRLSAVVVVVLGGVVLIGWALDLQPLETVAPGLVSMKANTASCFALCGCSLLLWHRDGARERQVGTLLAGIVVAVAAATLFEYARGVHLGIDQLLFTDRGTPAG